MAVGAGVSERYPDDAPDSEVDPRAVPMIVMAGAPPPFAATSDTPMEKQVGVRRPWTPLYIVMYLPVGISQGFVSVTLAYVLRQTGVSVAAIAGLVGLNLLPWTWKVLGGPMLDLALTPRTWNLVFGLLGAAALITLGAIAGISAALPMLSLLTLLLGVSTVLSSASINNIIGAVEPENERGAIGGYSQAGTGFEACVPFCARGAAPLRLNC